MYEFKGFKKIDILYNFLLLRLFWRIQAIKRNHRGDVVNVQLVTEQRIVQDVTIAK